MRELLGINSLKDAARTSSDETTLCTFLGPDCLGAENDPILQLISSATRTIDTQLLGCGLDWDWLGTERESLYLEALLEKAAQGVKVRLILDGNYTNLSSSDDNYDTYLFVKNRAEQEGYAGNISVRLYTEGRFLKIHNKGMIVDGERVLLGSVNWSPGGVLENREAGVVLESKEIGEFFSLGFEEDWVECCSQERNEEKKASVGLGFENDIALLFLVLLVSSLGKRKSEAPRILLWVFEEE